MYRSDSWKQEDDLFFCTQKKGGEPYGTIQVAWYDCC